MNKITLIGLTEFKRLFNSPLAWSLLAILQFILAMMFLLLIDEFIAATQTENVGQEIAFGVTDIVVSRLYLWAGVMMLLVLPILTMRSFAQERLDKSLLLLTSSPLSFTQLVLGKYLALLLFILVVVAMVSLMPLSLFLGTTLDFGRVLSSALGLFLTLSSFAAAGLYISSLTAQPIIAAISTFGFLLLLVVLYLSGTSNTSNSELFIYLAHISHFFSFTDGLIHSHDLAYYVLFSLLFLILTVRRLDNQRLQG
ncbi:MAG: ABC transporter permease [Cocleimonas sp.]|nr:ABC transporter permease [Cocleimonas sp.]